MMAKIMILFALFSFTNVVASVVTGVAREHCCQNELCPIDCVRCDGKPTCYDLSDELGCNNETDVKLLSYKKPPIFVPIILAVLKAQLRREKVELGYRFPDRNCFTTPMVKDTQPSYDVMGITKPAGVTTTETPVWLQLLMKLKESFGITTTSTTTTEMPVWKMLLNKLKAEQTGDSFTTSSPVKSWSNVGAKTTPAYQASPTPPWRRTARPPTTQSTKIIEQTATEIRDTTTNAMTEPVTAGKTQRSTAAITTEQTKAETREINTTVTKEPNTTVIKARITTEITEPNATEMKIQRSKDRSTEKESFSNAESLVTGVPVTIKETVFFTTPKHETLSRAKQQEIVTQVKQERPNENSLDVTRNDERDSSYNDSSTVRTDYVSSVETTISIKDFKTGNDKDKMNVAVKQSDHLNSTANEQDNSTLYMAGLSKTIVNTTLYSESISNQNITEFSTIPTVVLANETQNKSAGKDYDANLTVSLNENNKQADAHGSTNESMISDFTTQIPSRETETADTFAQSTEVTTKDVPLSTTALPFNLATDNFGVQISAEFSKTLNESETPSPLQERVLSTETESLKSNLTGTKFGFNVSRNNYSDNFDSENSVKTDIVMPSVEMIKKHSNDQIYVNTSNFVSDAYEKYNNNGKSSSLNPSPPVSPDSTSISDLSDVSKLADNLLANYTNSNYTLLSGNITSSDFIYPSLQTNNSVEDKAKFNYSVGESSIHKLELYNKSNTKDNLQSYNATENSAHSFSVSVIRKQEKTRVASKENVVTSSLQMSPEKEVRIMLGKLNALVSKRLTSSDFPSQPVLRDFGQTQADTTVVRNIATEKPTLTTRPSTTEPPVSHFPERKQLTQPATIPQVQRAAVTPRPWWQETTLSPFSLDNLFGFTTPPSVGQNWFNPTTNAYSWDAVFGVGGIPVSQVPTVSPYDANQNIINNIYDPLQPNTQIQESAINPTVQPTGSILEGVTEASFGTGRNISLSVRPISSFRETANTNAPIRSTGGFVAEIATNPLVRPTDTFDKEITTKSIILQTGHNVKTIGSQIFFSQSYESAPETYIPSRNTPTTRSYNSQKTQVTTPKPLKVFDIFNNGKDSQYPGNFSVVTKPSAEISVPPFGQPTTKFIPHSNVLTTTSNSLNAITSEATAFSPITFPQVKLSSDINNSENVPHTAITTERSLLQPEKISTPFILSEKKQDVNIVYDITTPKPPRKRRPGISTKSPATPVTSVIMNLWNTGKQIQETDPIPATTAVTPATTISDWNPGSNRVLSTDIISSWWAQVQPTTMPPVYVTQPPTPTPVASLEHCYQVQDSAGFCQSIHSGHYKNPSDCRSFYVCIWGFLHSCACPPNTMFDGTINVCNWDFQVTCTQNQI